MMLNPMQMINDPLFKRAQQMANGKSEQEIKQIASNLCKERGIDMDKAFSQFKTMFGINR